MVTHTDADYKNFSWKNIKGMLEQKRSLQPFHYYITDSVSYYKPPEEGDKSAFWGGSDVTNVDTNQTVYYR